MKVRLGDVCTVVSGSTPKTGNAEYWDGNIDWITPAELSDDSYVVNESVRKITELGAQKTGLKPFPAGTVILSSRAPIGKVAIAGKEMYCNQGFKNLICSDRIVNTYLYWYLKGNTQYLNSLGRGATFKEISKKIVEGIEINLPSIEEQKRDSDVLRQCWAVIQKRAEELNTLDMLIKARFVEMFGDPINNEKGWPKERLTDIAEIKIGPFGSLLHKEDYISGGHALVNPSHIVDGKIIPDPDLTIDEKKYNELSAYQLNVGDIVLGRRGEMGRCAVVDRGGLLCGTGSMIIRPVKKMRSFFLQNILSSPGYKRLLEDKAVGVTMPNLNVPIVSEIKVPILPESAQDQYINFMEQVDHTKSAIQASLAETQTLFDSLMQKYFG